MPATLGSKAVIEQCSGVKIRDSLLSERSSGGLAVSRRGGALKANNEWLVKAVRAET